MIKIIVRENEAPGVVFEKLANAEAEVKCQLFFNPVDPENPTEEERLNFTTSHPLPKFEKIDEVEQNWNLAGIYNFFKNNVLLELRP